VPESDEPKHFFDAVKDGDPMTLFDGLAFAIMVTMGSFGVSVMIGALYLIIFQPCVWPFRFC
jgi:hypothetical protein